MDSECPNICDAVELDVLSRLANAEKLRQQGLTKKKSLTQIADMARETLLLTAKNAPVLSANYRKELEALQTQLASGHHSDIHPLSARLNMLFQSLDVSKQQQLIAALTLYGREAAVEKLMSSLEGKYTLPGPDPDDTEAIMIAMSLEESEADLAASKALAVAAEVSVGQFEPVDSSPQAAPTASMSATVSEGGSTVRVISSVSASGLTEVAPAGLQHLGQVEDMVLALSLRRVDASVLLSLLPAALKRVLEYREDALISALHAIGLPAPLVQQLFLAASQMHRAGILGSDSVNGGETLKLAIEEVRARIDKLHKDAEEAQYVERINFGKNNELFALWGQCFELKDKEYRYEVCPFKQAKQDAVLLGNHYKANYRKIPRDESDPFSSAARVIDLVFTGGQTCWGVASNPQRSFVLVLECDARANADGEDPVSDADAVAGGSSVKVGSGSESQLVDLTEPEPCSYTARLLTPLACF